MATTKRETTVEKRMSIVNPVKALEGIFDKANKVFYNGELETPVITFSSDESKKSYGHITVNKVWHEGERDAYEINICCNMTESNEQVIGTLLHEMAHLYNIMHGIKDVSGARSSYHNANFQKTANEHGLNITEKTKYGYIGHELNEAGKKFADTCKADLVALKRDTLEKGGKAKRKSVFYVHVCPSCEAKARTTSRFLLICGDCGCNMHMTEK